jgi:hypothetical protein
MERTSVKRVNRLQALWLAAVVALTVVHPGAASAEENLGSEAGLGAGSALCTLIYGPVKVVYATLGLIFGGIAWGLSGGDREVLDAITVPSVRGDYVVTPAHLTGSRELEFFGRRPGYEVAPPPHQSPDPGFDDPY